MIFSHQESKYDQDLNWLANSIKFPFTSILRAAIGAIRSIWSAEGWNPRLYSLCKAGMRSDRITVTYMNVLIT